MNSLDYLAREEVLKAIDKRIRDLDNSIHSRVKNAQLQLMALRKEITEMDSIGWKGHEEAKSSVADLLAMQKTIGDDYSEICGKAATEITDLAIQLRIAEDSIERNIRIDTFNDDPEYGCYFEDNGDMDGIVAWMSKPKPYKPAKEET